MVGSEMRVFCTQHTTVPVSSVEAPPVTDAVGWSVDMEIGLVHRRIMHDVEVRVVAKTTVSFPVCQILSCGFFASVRSFLAIFL